MSTPPADRRRWPATDRVAHVSLQAQVAGLTLVPGDWMRVGVPLVDLCTAPDGPRTRQLLRGARFLALEARGAMVFGQCAHDRQVGWLPRAALIADHAVTHRVCAPATHVYSRADLKSPEVCELSLGVQLELSGQQGDFHRIAQGGWVPVQHMCPLCPPARDPVAIAQALIGTPYLWGGNSRRGVDCSGLVQLACMACGIDCPADSDQQAAELGTRLPRDARLRRGDLLFWPGHVAWVVAPDTQLHASAHHMAVVQEPLARAQMRIAAQTGHELRCRRRLQSAGT